MTLILNDADWDELHQQSPKPFTLDLALDEFEECSIVPKQLCQGYTREMELFPGVWLDWADRQFHQDWMIKIPVHDL